MNGEPAPRVLGLRPMLDKYLPFKEIKETMPFRTKTAGIKAGFDADPRSWEARPLTSKHVRPPPAFSALVTSYSCRHTC